MTIKEKIFIAIGTIILLVLAFSMFSTLYLVDKATLTVDGLLFLVHWGLIAVIIAIFFMVENEIKMKGKTWKIITIITFLIILTLGVSYSWLV